MKPLTDLIQLPFVETLGWTLLHFVWQGALIALILAALLWLLKNHHPTLRYGLSCASLALMFLCPIISYLVLDARRPTPEPLQVAIPPVQNEITQAAPALNNEPVQPVAAPVVFAPEGGEETEQGWLERYLKPYLPYFVIFWSLGVLLLSIRLMGGLWYLRKLRTSLTKPVSAALMSQLSNVAERLGLARTVQMRESLIVTVPLVIGWIKPMILLPTSALSGLSHSQLEMILAHELAHIRRHDYLVNLLQSIIETLLFYHPAVWWVSNRIRVEREHCCDDIAVSICGGDRESYATALADLDRLRPRVKLAQAASGGSLFNRIVRLLDRAMPRALEPRQWIAGLTMIVVSVLLFTFVGISLTIAQDEEITLSLGIADPMGRPSQAYIEEFINQVTTLSDGKITIEPTWEAGYNTTPTFEQGVAKAMIEGQYDLGLAASRAWDSVGVMSLQPLQAPFLINNDAIAKAVAASDIATQMLEGMSSVGITGLTIWPDVLNHPMSFDFEKPFLSPEDFAGKTIRIIGSNITTAMYEAFGATTTVKEDWAADIEAGLIQGTELGLAQGFALPAPAVVVGNVANYPKYHVLVANSASFERLSDEQQNILREAASVIQQQAISEHPKEVDAATAFCQDGAGNIVLASDEQLAAFEEAAKPVYALIEQDPKNAEFIAAIRELKANTPAAPGAAACQPTTSSVDSNYLGTLPPNGIYHREITEEELRAKGASRDFAISQADRSDGGLYWIFKDGKAYTDLEGECYWTYSSVDDVLNLEINPPCNDIKIVLKMLWREQADGALDIYFLSSSPSTPQDLVNDRALFEGIYQKVGEVSSETESWSEGLPPNGTWQVKLTPDDLIGMGLSQSTAQDWSGVYTWVFENGKGSLLVGGPMEQTNSGGCEANIEAAEDGVRIVYTSGKGCENEVDHIQWRLADDGLHFHLVEIVGAPFNENKAVYEAKAWQKVETWSEGLPPNGVWQADLTQEDLIAAGLPKEKTSEVIGLAALTFQDGKFTFQVQMNGNHPGSCDGNYALVEDFVRFTYTNGCTGEVDDIQWRLEEDGLHLHLVDIKGARYEENRALIEAKPWQKIE